MSRLVRLFVVGATVSAAALCAAPASAQEVSLGYQWQQFSIDLDDTEDVFVDDSITAPIGFNLDVAGPISGNLDIVGQFDWSRQSDDFDFLGESFDATWNFVTFGGGVRWSSRMNPRATPFVQALLGATRTSFGCEVAGVDCADVVDDDDLSSTDPMLQIGGGVAVPMGAWSALGQFDYRRIFGDGEGVNSIRFVLGVRVSLQ